MMSPSSASQGSDALLLLLDLLSDPEAAKVQLTAFKNAADSATDAEKRLTESKVEHQNLLSTIGQQLEKSRDLISGLRSVMDQAAKVVADAEVSKVSIDHQVVSIVREGEKALSNISARVDGIVEMLDSEIEQRMEKVAKLEQTAAAAEKRFNDASAKLEELRASF